MYGKKDFKEKLLLDGFKNNPPLSNQRMRNDYE